MSNSTQASKLQSLLDTPTSQLYSLVDISTARSWDYSLPTITTPRSFTPRLNFNSDESFFQIFKDINRGLPYRLLEHAGVFSKNNEMVLFGGCLLDIVLGRGDSIKDFDLRLVGQAFMNDEAKCVDKAKEFVSSIFSFLTAENEKVDQRIASAKENGKEYNGEVKCNVQEIVVSRARSTVSVHVPSFGYDTHHHWFTRSEVFQFTFSPVESIQDLFQACSPHCTRIAVKDGSVVLDHLARFSIENTAIVLDTSSLVNFYCSNDADEVEQAKRISSGRMIAGQFGRYIRYHEAKGFDLILPLLDMGKVPRRNLEYDVPEVLPLPFMTVVYSQVDSNSIMATDLRLQRHLAQNYESGLVGYYDSCPAPNVGESIHHNVRCLVNEVYDSFKYVAKGERWDHVFDFTPSLTPRMVRKSYETVTEDLTSGDIPVHRLTGYFSVTSPHDVVEKLIARPLSDKMCRKGTLPKPFVLDKDMLKELVELEVSRLIEKIEHLQKTLESKGLDKLVCQFPENVSTEEEVVQAIYGGMVQRN